VLFVREPNAARIPRCHPSAKIQKVNGANYGGIGTPGPGVGLGVRLYDDPLVQGVSSQSAQGLEPRIHSKRHRRQAQVGQVMRDIWQLNLRGGDATLPLPGNFKTMDAPSLQTKCGGAT
jgi:hypothetical protein